MDDGADGCGDDGADGRVDDRALTALEDELTAFWRRARVVTRDAARELHPRLDPGSYPLVAVLRNRGPLGMSELGAVLLHDKSTLSRQVEVLVRLGLVERTVDPADGRARLVSLTQPTQERLDVLLVHRREQWRHALRGWDDGEVGELARLLRKLGESDLT